MELYRPDSESSDSPLAVELQAFEERLPEMLEAIAGQVGEVPKYALFKRAELLGTYVTQADAIDEGFRRLGDVPFLVREITKNQRVLVFMRPIRPVVRTPLVLLEPIEEFPTQISC